MRVFTKQIIFRCKMCENGWIGIYCDLIDCGTNGKVLKETGIECICHYPYSGQFCNELKTKNIYMHYNLKMQKFGLLGTVIFIPLFLFTYICKRIYTE